MNAETISKQPSRESLLQLVALQEASGCWQLDPALDAALGKTTEEVEKRKPAAVGCHILTDMYLTCTKWQLGSVGQRKQTKKQTKKD